MVTKKELEQELRSVRTKLGLLKKDLQAYDGTQVVKVHLLTHRDRVGKIEAFLANLGYIMYLNAEDAPQAVFRFAKR